MSKIIELQLREVNSVGGGVLTKAEIKKLNACAAVSLKTVATFLAVGYLFGYIISLSERPQNPSGASSHRLKSVAKGVVAGIATGTVTTIAGIAWIMSHSVCKFQNDINEKSENKTEL